jgi:hypothetical protein
MPIEGETKRYEADPPAHYERRGINVRITLLAGLLMIVTGLLVHFSATGLFILFRNQSAAKDVQPSAVMLGQPKRLPPEPRLQSDEAGDLDKLRKNEDAILNTYGWVDRKAGIVRIPVDRALDLIAERGLPSVPGQLAPVQQPAAQPEKSSQEAPPTSR